MVLKGIIQDREKRGIIHTKPLLSS